MMFILNFVVMVYFNENCLKWLGVKGDCFLNVNENKPAHYNVKGNETISLAILDVFDKVFICTSTKEKKRNVECYWK